MHWKHVTRERKCGLLCVKKTIEIREMEEDKKSD